MKAFCQEYVSRLSQVLETMDWTPVERLAKACERLRQERKTLYICGNGGSAANAQHMANDFLYGTSPRRSEAIKVEALAANSAVLTCLGNDLGYDEIFARQIQVKGEQGDLLLVLSGSGNSPNILKAIEAARERGMSTFGILGFTGGLAFDRVDEPIHFPIQDMQIAEDCQLVVGHMLMRALTDES